MTDLHEKNMQAEDFDALLDLHGADLSRWPMDQIKPALALMAADDTARVRFDGMRQLDDSLRAADALVANRLQDRHGATAPQLQDNIMRRLRGEEAPVVSMAPALVAKPTPSFLRSLYAPIASLVMVGVIGFVMGVQQPANADDSLLDGLVNGQDIVITGDQSLTGGL